MPVRVLGAAMPAVDYDVALEVASHEALIRQAYKDSAGIWTWCVGMTNATGHHVERYIGKPQSLAYCMRLYVWALTNYARGVYEAFDGYALTKAQFAAALSFHWNTGAIGKASWVKLWKQGDIAGAKKAFMNWVTPPEIKGRRGAERALFFDGEWSNTGKMLEYTQLTKKSTPVWKSGVLIDVRAALKSAFAAQVAPVLDTAPQPNSVPAAKTLSPAR